ncbi:protein kinase family protein [Stackebrandtia nassauensis]|nr:hypothetical protein [Stackebrandtia nassauensis]
MQPLEDGDPERIGRFRLESRLGSGGTFLGLSEGGRTVVVKLLDAGAAAAPGLRERLSAMRGVGGFALPQLIDVDLDASPPWLATAYVPGPSLSAVVDERGPLPETEVAALGAALAEALDAMHQYGLAHGDLKPGNVIMASDGPRLVDVGVAVADASPAADVFALGRVLTFAATATDPVAAEAPWPDGIDGELREVLAACLARDPRERPGAVEVLERLANHRATGAESLSVTSLTSTESRPTPRSGRRLLGRGGPGTGGLRLRRRTILMGGAAILAATAVPAALAYWPSPRGQRLTGMAVTSVAFSPTGDIVAGGGGNENRPEGDGRLWNPDTGRELGVMDGRGISGVAFSADGGVLATSGPRGARIRDPDTGETIAMFDVSARENVNEEVWAVALSADAKRLAVGGRTLDEIETVCVVWNVSGTERIASLTTTDIHCVRSVALSPDGRCAALAGVARGSGTANKANYAMENGAGCWLWGLESGNAWGLRKGELRVVYSGGYANAVAFGPDGDTLAVASRDSGCRLWTPESERAAVTYTTDPVSGIAFSPDGAVLATAGTGVAFGMDRFGRFEVEGGPAEAADGPGKQVSGAGIRLWNTTSGDHLDTVTEDYATSVAFGPDGRTILGSGGDGGTDTATGCWLWPIGLVGAQ